MRKKTLEIEHDKVKFITARLIGLNTHLIVTNQLDMLLFDLELWGFQNALLDGVNRDFKLQRLYCCQIDFEREVAALG